MLDLQSIRSVNESTGIASSALIYHLFLIGHEARLSLDLGHEVRVDPVMSDKDSSLPRAKRIRKVFTKNISGRLRMLIIEAKQKKTL